jgi:hypothetical protein
VATIEAEATVQLISSGQLPADPVEL